MEELNYFCALVFLQSVGQLFFIIAVGLTGFFLTTVLCVFVPSNLPYYPELMAFFTILVTILYRKLVDKMASGQMHKLNWMNYIIE